MTDPLGQSQVLPYLKGLSNEGYQIHLASCEKKAQFKKWGKEVQVTLAGHSIHWYPVNFYRWPSLLSTLYNYWRLRQKARQIVKNQPITLLHSRGCYLTSLIALPLKRKYNLKYIFDMRGFWVDERVEGGLWNLKNPFYKILYRYFKKKERQFFSNADITISLTQKGKEVIHNFKHLPNQPIPIKVIPCCVDTSHFKKSDTPPKEIAQKHGLNNLNIDSLVLSYLGSIGTWYLLDEMLRFFKVLKEKYPNAQFLFITTESATPIYQKAQQLNIDPQSLFIQSAPYQQVPELLQLSNISVFFYNPTFSKVATSPTKQAEIMSLGIPVICNEGVGDTPNIVKKNQVGAVVKSFNHKEFQRVTNEVDQLLTISPSHIRSVAIKYFDLKMGIKKYAETYQSLISPPNK
jgi:glycosyltransferase involved in cell wall biosynthesis